MKKIIVFLTALILCAFSAMGQTNQPKTNSKDNPATETAPTINPQDSKDKQAGPQGSTETAPTINPTDSKDKQAGSQGSDTETKDADAKGTNGEKSNQTTTPQKTKQKQQKTKTTPPNEQQNTGSNDNAQNDSDADTSEPVAPTTSQEEGSNTGSNSDTNTYKEIISSLEYALETERGRFRKISIPLGVIAGLLLIILIIVLVLKKKADAQTLGSQTELQGMIDDLEDKVQSLTKEKAELESQKSNWEREKRSLEQEITGLRNKKAPVAPIAPSPKPAPPQPQSLYADVIVNGKFNRVKEQPDSAETNFELRLDSPNATSAKIYIYPGAERRILVNPAFLEGCDKQILGNSRVETTQPGLAQKEGENNWVVTKKPEVIIR